MTKPILIVGGNGFLGSHLVDRLLADHSVVVLDTRPRRTDVTWEGVSCFSGSSANSQLVSGLLRDLKIETVFYLGWTSIGETATRDPGEDIRANVLPAIAFLDVCVTAGVKRIIFTSSGGTVYGIPERLPVSEDHPLNPINAYGAAKVAVETYLRMYHHLYGLEYVIARPSVPYGPGQDVSRRQGAVSVFIDKALKGEPITIFGDGETVRDYFYVTDLADALAKMIDCEPNQTFNIAGPRGYTLMELIAEIEATLDVKIRINYEPGRKIDVHDLSLNTAKIESELKWSAKVDLREGIKRTAEWIRQNACLVPRQ